MSLLSSLSLMDLFVSDLASTSWSTASLSLISLSERRDSDVASSDSEVLTRLVRNWVNSAVNLSS